MEIFIFQCAGVYVAIKPITVYGLPTWDAPINSIFSYIELVCVCSGWHLVYVYQYIKWSIKIYYNTINANYDDVWCTCIDTWACGVIQFNWVRRGDILDATPRNFLSEHAKFAVFLFKITIMYEKQYFSITFDVCGFVVVLFYWMCILKKSIVNVWDVNW